MDTGAGAGDRGAGRGVAGCTHFTRLLHVDDGVALDDGTGAAQLRFARQSKFSLRRAFDHLSRADGGGVVFVCRSLQKTRPGAHVRAGLLRGGLRGAKGRVRRKGGGNRQRERQRTQGSVSHGCEQLKNVVSDYIDARFAPRFAGL